MLEDEFKEYNEGVTYKDQPSYKDEEGIQRYAFRQGTIISQEQWQSFVEPGAQIQCVVDPDDGEVWMGINTRMHKDIGKIIQANKRENFEVDNEDLRFQLRTDSNKRVAVVVSMSPEKTIKPLHVDAAVELIRMVPTNQRHKDIDV